MLTNTSYDDIMEKANWRPGASQSQASSSAPPPAPRPQAVQPAVPVASSEALILTSSEPQSVQAVVPVAPSQPCITLLHPQALQPVPVAPTQALTRSSLNPQALSFQPPGPIEPIDSTQSVRSQYHRLMSRLADTYMLERRKGNHGAYFLQDPWWQARPHLVKVLTANSAFGATIRGLTSPLERIEAKMMITVRQDFIELISGARGKTNCTQVKDDRFPELQQDAHLEVAVRAWSHERVGRMDQVNWHCQTAHEKRKFLGEVSKAATVLWPRLWDACEQMKKDAVEAEQVAQDERAQYLENRNQAVDRKWERITRAQIQQLEQLGEWRDELRQKGEELQQRETLLAEQEQALTAARTHQTEIQYDIQQARRAVLHREARVAWREATASKREDDQLQYWRNVYDWHHQWSGMCDRPTCPACHWGRPRSREDAVLMTRNANANANLTEAMPSPSDSMQPE